MRRRDFIKTTAAAAVLARVDGPALARKAGRQGRVRLKVGILSDIHIKLIDPGSVDTFVKALEFYRDQRVDAVLIAGDMADTGMATELRMVADAWYKVFPDDKLPDGTAVEKLFVYGNHDIEAWKYGYVKKRSNHEEIKADRLVKDRAAIWEELFHEPWSPIYIKDVKGYKFIGGHFANNKNMPGLEEFLRQHASELPAPGKPFFYFQHTHPKETCSGPWVWGQDNGEVTALLSEYPNVISFSGHSHTMLTDERVIWQGTFTSVGTASLSYVGGLGGRENSTLFGSSDKTVRQMAQARGRDAHHGMLMTVYDDQVLLRRRDFGRDEDLGDDWVIPTAVLSRPLAYGRRAEKELSPEFGRGAAVSTARHSGKDRGGTALEQMSVTFPTAPRTGGTPRALDYEVCVEVEDVDTWKTVLTKRVYSETVWLSDKADAGGTVRCEFGLFELPAGRPFRFAVRPCACFGHKGEPIFSDTMSVEMSGQV